MANLRDFLFHEEPGITLYCGDCRDVLPLLGEHVQHVREGRDCGGVCVSRVDLLLTDPPYGMNYEPARRGDGSKRWGAERITGDSGPFDPAHLLEVECDQVVLFGANNYADKLPVSRGWIVWDKTPNGRKDGFFASDVELAWTNCLSLTRKFSLQWGGEARNGEEYLHPTQKPVALMRWAVELVTGVGALVLDPYMGSGPVIQACRETGRRAIGIEIEPKYCEIAVKRLRQEVLPL